MKNKVDVAVIGAGFAGSILSAALAKSGLRVALIDSTHHPRFAIGESSTPLADMILRRLGKNHQLPYLESLATWSSWQSQFPEIACGRKRGFSYYQHQRNQGFSEQTMGQSSLLVAASANDDVADTHWYRAEVDQFLFQRAVDLGVKELLGHRVVQIEKEMSDTFTLRSVCTSGEATLQSDWIVDASGTASVSAKLLAATDLTHTVRTKTRTTYGHYRGVGSWSQKLTELGHDVGKNPFDSDDAAQHHLLKSGWLWMLRFNNEITSVGRTEWIEPEPLKQTGHGNSPNITKPQSLPHDLHDYPSLAALMATASLCGPAQGVRSTSRLQRLFAPLLSQRHLMLPTAAMTLDPLHSTGIAHALAGVDRLLDIILLKKGATEQSQAVQQYETSFFQESQLLDELVSTAYLTMEDFERFTAACMLYFAGAICCEERYQQGQNPTHLWNADDRQFVEFAKQACIALRQPNNDYQSLISEGLAPWNTAGLMDPKVQNRYAYTATK
ncbi:MAG: FAD-dependent oxidoreductase [Rubripirellula sp.]|nr:FAD-dependent oxidoreductase [Rubripirellula sp.]